MSQDNMHDDQLHESLATLGSKLPEPTASDRIRDQIAKIDGQRDAARAGSVWQTAALGLFGAMAATLAIMTSMLYSQNAALRQDLAAAQQALSGERGSTQTVSHHVPPLVALSVYHEKCPIAGAIAPLFESLKKMHCEDQILFVTLDVSEDMKAQAAKLAEALDCEFIFASDEAPLKSGTVILADMRNRKIIATSHNADELMGFGSALGEALQACTATSDP